MYHIGSRHFSRLMDGWYMLIQWDFTQNVAPCCSWCLRDCVRPHIKSNPLPPSSNSCCKPVNTANCMLTANFGKTSGTQHHHHSSTSSSHQHRFQSTIPTGFSMWASQAVIQPKQTHWRWFVNSMGPPTSSISPQVPLYKKEHALSCIQTCNTRDEFEIIWGGFFRIGRNSVHADPFQTPSAIHVFLRPPTTSFAGIISRTDYDIQKFMRPRYAQWIWMTDTRSKSYV